MKKTLALLAALALMGSTLATVQAATLKCTVTKVEDNVVTMDCGDKAKDLAAGTEVKVKTAKAKAAAIEGC
ncbi:MAG: hypothetical protein ABFR63_07000 [Thermodesulfobacteriota bacterium]